MRELTLYTRQGCHLCEDIERQLQPWLDSGRIGLRRVDIDDDPGLRERFNARVPVLMAGTHAICEYFLDPLALDAFLSGDGEAS